jgi:pyruvate formate lyase activating enzyme
MKYLTPAGEHLQCGLCPRRCRIPPGGFGRCGVRQNRNGAGVLPFYGYITAMAADPIEKKPLYHFRPGSSILSLGFAGCNLHCPFCQNWEISQGLFNPRFTSGLNQKLTSGFSPETAVPGKRRSPREIIAAARTGGFRQIAYTYSEPLIHLEFLLDCMTAAREAGIANILVSNGCVEPEAALEILALTDAANIDLKCFSEDTYSRVLGGSLRTVLAFIEAALNQGVHLELTTLLVPGLNDRPEETAQCAAFIAALSPDIPWHLSAYHPAYQWTAPPTDRALLLETARRASETLSFVYLGNLTEAAFSDTPCPACGKPLVQRRAYHINTGGLRAEASAAGQQYYCAHCGSPAPIHG